MARRNDSTGGAAGAFDRDFGYLLPFLDKVTAAASQLPDAAARSELQRLMAEEKQRWTRIRELLSGAVPTGPMPRPAARVEAAPAPALTVGSLKPSR